MVLLARAEKAGPPPPPGHMSWEDYHRQRAANHNAQIAERDRHSRELREIFADPSMSG
jgi:hypothetical protein